MDENTKKLKIGMVLDDGLDKPDGVQQYILDIGGWLRSQGHEVSYLVGETKRQDISGVRSLSHNIRVRSNGNSMSIPLPAWRPKLHRFLKDQKFDVLHVQTPYSPFMGGQLITLASSNTAIVGTFHILPNSWLITLGTKLLGLWCYFSLKHFDAMLSVSPAAADFAKSTFKISSSVSPNVVNRDRFHNAKPFERYDDDVATILFLGRLVPRKGSMVLLKAIEILKKQPDLPKFRVLICGAGAQEHKLRHFIARHGLESYVEMLGFVSEEDKPRYYASADIAVFPSSGGESFGIVLLEAMASGRTVVLAGNNPGYASVMAPQPDLLFDAKDPEALAIKLVYYLKNPAERQVMGEWAWHYAKRFDVHNVGAELVGIYLKALRKKRRA